MRNLFLYIIILFISISCSKEDRVNKFDISSKSLLREGNYDVLDDISVFSRALSRGLVLNRYLRSFIKERSIDNQNVGFKELLINCIRSEEIGLGVTFEESLDSLVRYYSNGQGSNEVISNILSQLPTFSVRIPDKFANIIWNINEVIKTPAVVYYTPDTIITANGSIIQTEYFSRDKTIYYLELTPAEGYLELDLNSGTLNNGGLKIQDFIGDLSDSCKQSFDDYINTITDNCKKYSNRVIFEVHRMYDIINGCSKINDLDDDTSPPPTPPLCLTEPIRDVDDQHYTYNYYEGFGFQSVDAVDYVNNQPGGEKYFAFIFFWAHAKNGSKISHKRTYFARVTDLYKPPKYKWVPDLSDCDDRDILSGNTDGCGYWELVSPGKVLHYSIPVNSRYFFEATDSRWYLDDVGKYFMLEIVEVDEVSTSSTHGSSVSTSSTLKVDFSVPFYEKVNAGGGWSFTDSKKVQSSTTITGASIVTIGQEPIDWCDQESKYLNYAWGNILSVKTGVDVLHY